LGKQSTTLIAAQPALCRGRCPRDYIFSVVPVGAGFDLEKEYSPQGDDAEEVVSAAVIYSVLEAFVHRAEVGQEQETVV